MAEIQKTTNYNLLTPSENDFFNVDHQNVNMGIIDAELKNLNEGKEALVKNAAAKESLSDTDSLPLADSADAQKTKKITFANMKTALKSYFDTLYNKYTHPDYTSRTAGLYKVTVDGTGHVSAAAAVAKSDITALGIPAQDTVTEIVDNLTSTDAAKALSAKQGKTLSDLVNNLDANKVPTSRKINGKVLTGDISISANDIGISEQLNYKFKTYTTSGNFIVPANVSSVILLGCAAGGPGTSSGGGKAGEAVIYEKFSVSPSATIPITVGTGNTIFGSLLTLLANNLAQNAACLWGGIKLGLGGSTQRPDINITKPEGGRYEFLPPGATFKLYGHLFLKDLSFKIAPAKTNSGGGWANSGSASFGGYFGLGGCNSDTDAQACGDAGGFGAGGGGSANSPNKGAGSPGFLIVIYKEGE